MLLSQVFVEVTLFWAVDYLPCRHRTKLGKECLKKKNKEKKKIPSLKAFRTALAHNNKITIE
jgi:hypothetical protein